VLYGGGGAKIEPRSCVAAHQGAAYRALPAAGMRAPCRWQRIVTLREQRRTAQGIWQARSGGVHRPCSYRGSIGAMATQKRSISFDESVLREAELRIAESGGNLSAFVNAALLHELQVARGRELLAEDDAEFGAVPAEVETQVLAEWPA
jgi:hypothetical protein